MSMALINKLFSSRSRKTSAPASSINNKSSNNQNNYCNNLLKFTEEQVQVSVFRECDFRGRRLLFDSKSVTKVYLDNNNATDKNATKQEHQHYIEIADGYGYILSKPSNDLAHLREMVFGTVAMSFRGTVYKIHNLSLPPRLIFSQVFSSPRVRHHSQITASLDDSSPASGSSQTSCSDQSTSDQLSTASDTVLLRHRIPQTSPLDVPASVPQSSLRSSSGYGGELSTSSIGSEPRSMDFNETLSVSYNENSTHQSLPTCIGMADECRMRHRRASKLGITISLELTKNQESELEVFLMQHIALIESILWRVRRGVETAYIRHQTFVSSMYEISTTTAQWFFDLITCSDNNVNAWTLLSNCDIPINVHCDYARHLFTEHSSDNCYWRTFSKFLRPHHDKQNFMEIFIGDLCELVEHFDVKHTNFTLLTGVLTYHLGWVASVLPNEELNIKRASNPSVQQLSELYGCLGHPTKIAHTILIGNKKEDLINKFIHILTYFIRCGKIHSRQCDRANVEAENQKADELLKADLHRPSIAIPPTLTKSDKLLLGVHNVGSPKSETFHLNESPVLSHLTIKKSKTCLTDLQKMQEISELNISDATSGDSDDSSSKVLFVLGENEKLENINPNESTAPFLDKDFITNDSVDFKPSNSCTNLKSDVTTNKTPRAQSEEPQQSSKESSTSNPTKFRYAGVKFNFLQHPQIFENYMKSKNIELANMHMLDKKEFLSDQQLPRVDFSDYDAAGDGEDNEILQTPSNATELEFTSELVIDMPKKETAIAVVSEKKAEKKVKEFVRQTVPNTTLMSEPKFTPLKIIDFPMPPYKYYANSCAMDYQFSNTLLRPCSTNYLSNLVLQGVSNPSKDINYIVKKDLILSAKHPLTGEAVEESIAIMANVDTWQLNVISSHTYVIDKNIGGVPIGMSQLVANMLETLLHMWKLKTPAEFCLMHIEQKLREFCLQSKALAQMLLDTEFCTIELLTSTLKLEVNDVPLLMAVASLHTPELHQKYGLRFQ